MTDKAYLLWLILWVVVGALALFAACSKRWQGTGLPLAFMINMAVLHWFGALVSFFPWFVPFGGWRVVQTGFQISTLGIVAFAIGCFGIAPLLSRRDLMNEPLAASPQDRKFKRAFLIIGLSSYLGFVIGLNSIPSVTSLLATGFYFVFAAICLGLSEASLQGRGGRVYALLAITPVLPFFTMITQGFLGYGVGYALIVLSFFVTLHLRPVRLILIGLAVSYLGLSFFVTYARDRDEIRKVVWGGYSYEQRLDAIWQTCCTLEWFDPRDNAQLRRIDGRLNQNFFVGAAQEYIGNTRQFAEGETIWMAVLALIPRAIWLDKPIQAGSMDYVSKYTGFKVVYGVSFGMGYIFEFYVNFGNYGVFAGLMLVGFLVGLADRKAGQALHTGLTLKFGMWFVIGIILMNVGGSLVEVTPSIVATILMVTALKHFIQPDPTLAVAEAVTHPPVDLVEP